MAARQQKVRLHFLIALTLVVMVFGLKQFRRTYQTEQLRTASVRAEQELRQFVQPEQAGLQNLAMTAQAPQARDAAALLMQTRYLISENLKDRSPASARRISDALAAISGNFERLRAGELAAFPRAQPFLRAYHAELDDTFQPYGICVPDGYDGDYPMPVIVTLHGLQGFGRYQCLGAPYYEGALSVKPEGRGATDYMYLGEDDVVAVLEEVEQIYRTDPTRVYLVGSSMGATGCWNLAVHYPHLFAGIVPISGNADSVAWEQRWGWNPPTPGGHEGLRAFLHASLSPSSYAENLAQCHIVVAHGTGDPVVPVEHARRMVGSLRRLGIPCEYLEFPEATHGGLPGWVKDYAVAKVFGQPPASAPAHFRYRIASLRHDRAWWVTVDRLDSPTQFGEVEADLTDGCARLTAGNVSALTVHGERAPGEIRRVLIGGSEFTMAPEDAQAALKLEKYGALWRVAKADGLLKRKGLSGPVSDVLRDPFVVVYGTVGDDQLRKDVSYSEAQRFAGEWKMRYGEPPRLKPDTDVTNEDLAELNLLLFGGPSVNQVTRRLAAGLPIVVAEDAVRLGDREYRGEDAGVIACYPNPRNRDHMVALVAGTTPAALFQAWDRFGLWFNWGIYDKYKWFDYAVFDNRTTGPESFLTVGFFDNEWQLAPAGGLLGGGAEWEGVPSVRDALQPQGFPGMAVASEGREDKVALSDVQPAAISQYRGAVGFDRTYIGGPIVMDGRLHPKGLGVRPPSNLEFVLAGGFRRFTATVGLTEGFYTSASPTRTAAEEVVFEVWGDGHLLFATPPLNWRKEGSTTAEISVDVTGVQTLALKARPAGGGTWLYGAAVWADPVVTR